MFRASDVFGRKAGLAPVKPTVPAGAGQKRATGSLAASGAVSKTWDPATGQFFEEEMPADIQELMGIKKKAKTTQLKQEFEAWGGKSQLKALGPRDGQLALALPEQVKPHTLAPVGKVDASAPSVEYQGFCKVELNNRYYEKDDVRIHSRPTYWTADLQFFVYWQGEVQRWAICDASSFLAVRAGQYPGWAYKGDHKSLAESNGWMEAWGGEWKEPDMEVTYRSSSRNSPQWEDPLVQSGVTAVEFHGFTMKELNTCYYLKSDDQIQGRPSYWDKSGVYFIYWQSAMSRWAICDLKCLAAVREGQCPGWAYRSDPGFFANACGWMDRRGNEWISANIETGVVSSRFRGLKVELRGFFKRELNTQYTERRDVEIQGKASYWDDSETYFIYWQSSMKRWAVCDQLSLPAAKKGMNPGWAYRTDAQHFAKSKGWMEANGGDWALATVTCKVLEGTVVDLALGVKSEETVTLALADSPGPIYSAAQYRTLIEKVYEANNPSKLGDIENLILKYKSREHELFRMVCDKYKIDPEEIAAELPNLGSAGDDAHGQAGWAAEVGNAEDPEDGLEDTECPELTAKEYAMHIQTIYIQHNPTKLQDMGKLLQKYRNRERELYHEVCKKYGEHPAKFHSTQ